MTDKLNLADAILMGSSVVKPKAGVQHEAAEEGAMGCALGMANIAAGVTYTNFDPLNPAHRQLLQDNARSRGAASVWGEWVRKVVPRPCDCTHKTEAEMKAEALAGYGSWGNDAWIHYHAMQMLFGPRDKWIFKLLDREMAIQDVITHLFDVHVMAEPDRSGPELRTPEDLAAAYPVPKWTIDQLADWVRTVEGPAREEELARRQKELQEMYWPVTYTSFGLAGLCGAVTPDDDIQCEHNPDGSVTRHPIPRHGAYAPVNDPGVLLGGPSAVASNARPEDAAGQTSEITLADLQKMVEKMVDKFKPLYAESKEAKEVEAWTKK